MLPFDQAKRKGEKGGEEEMTAKKESNLRETLNILKQEKKEIECLVEQLVEKGEEKEKEIIFVKKMLE